MSFIWPPMLLTLALIPIGLLLYRCLDARRRRRLATYGGSASTPEATGRPGRPARAASRRCCCSAGWLS